MSTTGASPTTDRETPSVRLVIDGPRKPRVAPFRHRHSPRARRRARELGADLDRIEGSGPGGRVRQEDVERTADEVGLTPGTSHPRLAVDGPMRARVGPHRHAHSPRVRRLARELAVDLARVEGTGPSGRVRPVDVEEAASPNASASSSRRSDDAPPTVSTRSATPAGPGVVAGVGPTRTVQLDLGPTVAAWRRLTAGPRPEGVEATPFLLVAHALLAELPAFVGTAGNDSAPADQLVVVLDTPDLNGPRPVVDGHYLTILGLLRRLALAPDAEADTPAPLAMVSRRQGSGDELPAGSSLVDVRIGPLENRPVASQDEFGYQVTTIRPTVDLTVHHDPKRVPDVAVDQLITRLAARLAHIHRTIGV